MADIQEHIEKYLRYPHTLLERIDEDNKQRRDIEPNIGFDHQH